MQDLVHHAPSVPNLKAARLGSTNSSWASMIVTFLVSLLDQLPGVILRDPLDNDGDGPDLL